MIRHELGKARVLSQDHVYCSYALALKTLWKRRYSAISLSIISAMRERFGFIYNSFESIKATTTVKKRKKTGYWRWREK